MRPPLNGEKVRLRSTKRPRQLSLLRAPSRGIARPLSASILASQNKKASLENSPKDPNNGNTFFEANRKNPEGGKQGQQWRYQLHTIPTSHWSPNIASKNQRIKRIKWAGVGEQLCTYWHLDKFQTTQILTEHGSKHDQCNTFLPECYRKSRSPSLD